MVVLIGLAPIARKRPAANVAQLMPEDWHGWVGNLNAQDRAFVGNGLVHRRPLGNGSDAFATGVDGLPRGSFVTGGWFGTRLMSRRCRGKQEA